ncbi:aldo/keto reductase, partial [Clavibacter michiganensis]|uniref:aldo/keto reductase n=1 Tax=Clavibacter michiganensis TaxID=28447 RepID=UPI00292D9A7A
YNPLGGGLLTGRHQREQLPTDGRYGSSPLAQMYRSRYWNDAVFTAVEALRTIASDAGMSMVEAALRWALGRPVVDAVLIGGSRISNIRDNLAALSRGPLPTDLQDRLDSIPTALRGLMPAYNR